ncbi:hypothetical protein [Brevibacillus agri]|uniref:hypothetical protein n=1 Tax=Brevibacillus agri TaxID=51101 RepID=UPI0024C02EAF|nr:hypothetical protein [Brevibacillus agri]MED4569215.1 hypothetical protein [Brevibacillus agri]WHX32761.1 hypothetical protein QNK09_11390 [Brevibacillus agri]
MFLAAHKPISLETLGEYDGDYLVLTSDSKKLADYQADPIWGRLQAVQNGGSTSGARKARGSGPDRRAVAGRASGGLAGRGSEKVERFPAQKGNEPTVAFFAFARLLTLSQPTCRLSVALLHASTPPR